MVITTEILPCPALQSYVRCYTLREFDTAGIDFIKPLPANHEFALAFALSGSLHTNNTAFKDLKPAAKQFVVGLQTASKGILIFNGKIKFFTIQFWPHGFYKLFGIPAQLLTDNIFEAADVIKGMHIYSERLHEAADVTSLKKCSDEFLLKQLIPGKADDIYNSITSASAFIFQNPCNANIKNLAYHANMSLRSFELKFTQQVGIRPKLYARVTRFNQAILMKVQLISDNWTEICHQCGYYDQMHFIKDFKEFAGDSPRNFYKNTPLPSEDYRKQ